MGSRPRSLPAFFFFFFIFSASTLSTVTSSLSENAVAESTTRRHINPGSPTSVTSRQNLSRETVSQTNVGSLLETDSGCGAPHGAPENLQQTQKTAEPLTTRPSEASALLFEATPA